MCWILLHVTTVHASKTEDLLKPDLPQLITVVHMLQQAHSLQPPPHILYRTAKQLANAFLQLAHATHSRSDVARCSCKERMIHMEAASGAVSPLAAAASK